MSAGGLFSRETRAAREERLMEKQHEQRLHQQLQQQDAAYNKQGVLTTEYLETLVDHGIEEETALLLRNMLSKDYVLANYTRAEVREVVWLSRLELLKIKGLHPRNTAILQGEYRQFMFDDAKQGLRPLDPQQETLLSQALMDIFARVSRGEGGFQQDQFGKTIKESITHDSGDGGGQSGFFSDL